MVIGSLFSTKPTFDTDGWYFKDNYTNKVKATGVRIAKFDSTDDYGTFATALTYLENTTNPWTIEIVLDWASIPNDAITRGILCSSTDNFKFRFTAKGHSIGLDMRVATNTNELNVGTATSSFPSKKFMISYDGSRKIAGIKMYSDNLDVAPIPAVDNLSSNLTTGTWYINRNASYGGIGLASMKIWSGVKTPSTTDIPDIAYIVGNHGQGNVLYNIVNSANNVTLNNITPATFWGSTLDNIEPHAYTYGVTIYRNTSDNTYMPICGNNNLTISGFTRVGYFAPNSGLIKYLTATYLFNNDVNVSALIANATYTYAQLDAIVNTKYILFTKTSEQITNLTLKATSVIDVFESIFDGVYNNSITLSTGKVSTNSFYDFQYTGSIIKLKILSDMTMDGYKYVSILVNGVFYTTLPYTDDTYHDIALPAGIKNIRILTGYTLMPGSVLRNTQIVDLMGSKRKYTKQSNKLANKMVLICDSIGAGQGSMNCNYTAWAAKMMYQGLCDTTYLGYGLGKIADFAGDSTKLADTIAKITAAFVGVTGRKIVVIQAGINDCGLDLTPAATFLTYYLNLVQAIKAIGGIELYCLSPIHFIEETQLLYDYIAGIISICSSESVTHISGFSIMPYNTTYFEDRAHPNQTGNDTIFNYVKPIIYA